MAPRKALEPGAYARAFLYLHFQSAVVAGFS